jgi:hypothetical protein
MLWHDVTVLHAAARIQRHSVLFNQKGQTLRVRSEQRSSWILGMAAIGIFGQEALCIVTLHQSSRAKGHSEDIRAEGFAEE